MVEDRADRPKGPPAVIRIDSQTVLVSRTLRFMARRLDESISGLQAAMEMDPPFVPLRNLARGMLGSAIAEGEKAAVLSARGSDFVATLGYAYAAAGRRPEAEEILREREEIAKRRHVSSYQLALIHAGLGDTSRALEVVEMALQHRDWSLALLRVDQRFDPLSADSRFPDLVCRVGP